jgi:hypothetical protein
MLDFTTVRAMFRRLGANLDRDLSLDVFSDPDAMKVPWLIHQPKTNEELAENLFERLRGAGIEFSLNIHDVDADSVMLAERIAQDRANAMRQEE